MQSLYSWFSGHKDAPPAQQYPLDVIGTWTRSEMHQAICTGDVTALYKKAFPDLAAMLMSNHPGGALCCKEGTLPAVEGGVLSYLGCLMQMHPNAASVQYLALRLIFCMLSHTSSLQLATLAAPTLAALDNFGSIGGGGDAVDLQSTSSSGLIPGLGFLFGRKQPERNPLAGRSLVSKDGGVQPSAIGGEAAINDRNPPPHVVQEIHLMATAILCKISFAVCLPPETASYCANQLLEISKKLDNPNSRQSQQDARHFKTALERSMGNDPNAKSTPITTSIQQIEDYFNNRNKEMRKVLAKMVVTAIDALHDATRRFTPTMELLSDTDDGGISDSTMSALFRSEEASTTRRDLFDGHSALWLALLVSVGDEVPACHQEAVVEVMLAVIQNTTTSQLSSASDVKDNDTLSNTTATGTTNSLYRSYAPLTTVGTVERGYSRHCFYFGQGAVLQVAHYFRLCYKFGWVLPTNEQLIALFNIYLRIEGTQRAAAESRGGVLVSSHVSGAADDVTIGVVAAFEYILSGKSAITDVIPVLQTLTSVLLTRMQIFTEEIREQVTGASLEGGNERQRLHFIKLSCQLAPIVHRLLVKEFLPVARKWAASNYNHVAPGGQALLREVVLKICHDLQRYSVLLQEYLENIWLVTHAGTKQANSATNFITQCLVSHYSFMASCQCPAVAWLLKEFYAVEQPGFFAVVRHQDVCGVESMGGLTEGGDLPIATFALQACSSLVFVHPIVEMLLDPNSPLALQNVKALISTHDAEDAMTIPFNGFAGAVKEVNDGATMALLGSIQAKISQVGWIRKAERGSMDLLSKLAVVGGPGGGVRDTESLLRGLFHQLHPSTDAAIRSTSKATTTSTLPVTGIVTVGLIATLHMLLDAVVVAPPQGCVEATKIGWEVHEFAINTLLAATDTSVYDDVGLSLLESLILPNEARQNRRDAATSASNVFTQDSVAVVASRGFSLNGCSVRQLRVLANSWYRHTGWIANGEEVRRVESLLATAFPAILDRFEISVVVRCSKAERAVLFEIAKIVRAKFAQQGGTRRLFRLVASFLPVLSKPVRTPGELLKYTHDHSQ